MRWFIRRAKRRWERPDWDWELAGLRGSIERFQEETAEALMPTLRKAVDIMNEIGRAFARVGGLPHE